MIGVLIGILYHHIPFLQTFRLPKTIVNWTVLLPLSREREEQEPLEEPVVTQAPYQPSESQIESVLAMGFPRERVIEALRIHQGEVNAAVQYLLSHA